MPLELSPVTSQICDDYLAFSLYKGVTPGASKVDGIEIITKPRKTTDYDKDGFVISLHSFALVQQLHNSAPLPQHLHFSPTVNTIRPVYRNSASIRHGR
jgi:hypothetical protein